MASENFKLLPKTQQEALENIAENEEFECYSIEVLNNTEKGNNFQGKIINVKIHGKNKTKQEKSLHVIVKSASSVQKMREVIPVTLFYNSEITFYTKIIPVLKHLQDKYIDDPDKFNFVNCYKVHTKEFEEFLILDDIRQQGYNLVARTTTLSIDHLRLAIKNIAEYHSLSFALRKYCPELLSQFISSLDYHNYYVEKVNFYLEMTMSQAIKYVENENEKKLLENFGKNLPEKVRKCLDPTRTEPYNVLCHGDCWQNNIMFKYEDDKPSKATFLDWQLGKYCSPHIDLLHLLFSASDQNLRKNHYNELIDLYYETLKIQTQKMDCNIHDMYPQHIYKDHIADLAPYALLYSIISSNLLVRDEEDIPDIEEVMKDGIPDSKALEYNSPKATSLFSQRVSNLLNDFVSMNLI